MRRTTVRILELCCFLALLSAPGARVQAIVVINPDSTGNTTAPSDDPGWASMGRVGVVINNQVVPAMYGTESYLGGGYNAAGQYVGFVLTCDHVDTGTYSIFGGTAYKIVPNSAVTVHDSNNNAIDLKVIQIKGTDADASALPSLPRLNLAWAPPPVNATVTMIGSGMGHSTSSPNAAYFNADWYNTHSFVSASGSGDVGGYYWGTTEVMRWGTGTVSTVGPLPGLSAYSTSAFATDFSSSGTTYESAVASGDSGGLAFYKTSSGTWVAAGVPESQWRDFNPAIQSPTYTGPAVAGDVNGDGIVAGQDLVAVTTNWLHTGTPGFTGDLNSDGIINAQDLAIIASNWMHSGWTTPAYVDFSTLPGGTTYGTGFTTFGTHSYYVDISAYRNQILDLAPIPGDVNHDHIVNGQDLALVYSNWMQSVTPGTNGDVNYDGIINGQDSALIASNWLAGSAGYGGGSGNASAVPEPSTIVSLALGAAFLGIGAARRARRK